MKIGINLLLWTGHVAEGHLPILERIARTGFDGAEIPIFDISEPDHYRSLGRMMDDLGLQRTASTAIVGEAHNPLSPDPTSREAALEFVRGLIECATALGAQRIVGPLFQPLGAFTGRGPREDELERCAEFLRTIAPMMRDAGLVCAVEPLNRFEAYLLNTSEQALTLMQRVDDPAIGILYDTFHAHIEEKDPLAALQAVCDAGALAHFHVSENDRGTPGSGHAKIRESIWLLMRAGWDGWLTIEAFGKAVPELAAATRVWRDFFADPDEVVRDGHRFVRDCLSTA